MNSKIHRVLLLLNEYFNRIILQSYHTYTHIYTVISEVLHKKLYKKLKSRSIINNILKFKILKFVKGSEKGTLATYVKTQKIVYESECKDYMKRSPK